MMAALVVVAIIAVVTTVIMWACCKLSSDRENERNGGTYGICICCGSAIPEDKQLCSRCEKGGD